MPRFVIEHRCSRPFAVLAILCCFFFNDTATTEIYPLSLHDALPIYGGKIGSATIGYPNGKPDIHVCAVPGYGTSNAEIDPGSGRLNHYQATAGCTDTNPGTSRRLI